ncbi:hypothetical protein [Fibrella aestuarina]|uniref:hypothetical protein n=1 Tax=Fibrella aestuarina TaxID=651143 RepID=UPI00059D453B|nr:hypothetical protein [Fibrella aestuarina]
MLQNKKPSFALRHLTTKKVSINGDLRFRYFFEWSERTSPVKCKVNIELLDEAGQVLNQSTCVVESVHEAKNRWVMFDIHADLKPATFRYRTSRVLTFSDWATGPISGKTEDLSFFDHKE